MADSRRLRGRVAGQTAMADVLTAQADAPERGTIARFMGQSPLTSEARNSYRGALGELIVGDMLENLGPSWDVLHDIPLGDRLLDHLAIGPAGVYAVRAVNCTDDDVFVDGDALVVDGEPRDDIPAVLEDATVVARLLTARAGDSVAVDALLVIVDARRLTIRQQPEGVRIVASRDLQRSLGRSPRTLAGDDVARISDVADLAATWPPTKEADLDAQQLHRDFAIVRAEVRSALSRRLAWGALGFALVCGIAWGAAAAITAYVLAR